MPHANEWARARVFAELAAGLSNHRLRIQAISSFRVEGGSASRSVVAFAVLR
jgi:hypothetical protein